MTTPTSPMTEKKKISCPECSAWFRIEALEQVPMHMNGLMQCSGSYKTPGMNKKCVIVKEWVKDEPVISAGGFSITKHGEYVDSQGRVIGTVIGSNTGGQSVQLNLVQPPQPQKLEKPVFRVVSEGLTKTKVVIWDGVTEIDISNITTSYELSREANGPTILKLEVFGVESVNEVHIDDVEVANVTHNENGIETVKDISPWDVLREAKKRKSNEQETP